MADGGFKAVGDRVTPAALPISRDVAGLAKANARQRLIFLAFVTVAALAGLLITRMGVDRSPHSQFLGAIADHYLDPSGRAEFPDITGSLALAFTKSTGTMVNRGTEGGTEAVLWLRLDIPQLPGDPDRVWVLSYQETRAREVALFIGSPSDGRPSQSYLQGTVDPETGQAARFARFDLPAREISGKQIHLRIYTRSSKRALLWLEPAPTFAASETSQVLIFGCIFGVMATLFFYLTSIGVVLRDRTFAMLAALVACYFAYVASDRAFLETVFFPGQLTLSRIVSYVSTFLCYGSWLAFLLGYLRVRQYAPRIASIAGAVTIACFVLAIVGGIEVAFNVTLTRPYSAPFGLLALLTGIFAAAWVVRFNTGRAIAFFVCWMPTIAATASRLLLDTAPANSGGLFAVYGVYGAVTFSLLTFAIVLSIDIQHRESRMRRIAESNERRFEGFASAASDGFWETGADARLTLLTGSFAKWQPETGGATLPSILDDKATPNGRAAAETLRTNLNGNTPFRGAEIELVDGRTVELSGEPYVQSDGMQGWRGIITDVTARNARRQREAREQRIAAVGQLTSKVAHEINNLLHPVANLSQRVHDRLAVDDEGRRYLKLVMEASSRAATILSRILKSVHSQNGTTTPIPLSTACLQACEEISALVSGTIDLQYGVETQGGPLVQESEMFQVLANLVSNAIAATGNNGQVMIRLEQGEAEGSYRLSVIDDGPGIPPDLISKVQDPFFTTKAAGQGTGLGLSIVLDIVQGWGGRLALTSPPEGGAVATIGLSATPP